MFPCRNVCKNPSRRLLWIVVLFGALTFAAADWRDDALAVHNEKRKIHDAPPLVLDDAVNAYAQNWAQQMADMKKMEHSKDHKYGQNIYSGTGGDKNDTADGMRAVNLWYDEVSHYNFKKPGYSGETGHFTAVVWKNTKRLGMGIARSGDTVYICGSYDPPGNINVASEFEKNVLKGSAKGKGKANVLHSKSSNICAILVGLISWFFLFP